MTKPIVVITIPPGKKEYHYYWPKDEPIISAGNYILVKGMFGEQECLIETYLMESKKAENYLSLIRVLKRADTIPKSKKAFHAFINNATPLEGILTMNKFDRIKNESIDSLTETKDIVIKLQKGKAVITAVKTSLLEIDTLPKQLKTLLSIDGYSDLAIGVLINIAGNTFTDSKIIKKAASDANFAGSVEFSNQFTFIEKFIEDVIKKVLGSDQLTEVKTEE